MPSGRARFLLLAAGFAGGLVLAGAAPLHAFDFRDGRWRITIETEQRGIASKMPSKYQYEHCLTQRSFKPDLTPLNAGCRITDSENDGDEVIWRFACRKQHTHVYGYARLEFAGTRFRGTLTTISESPHAFEIVQKLSGRYLGECRRDEPARPSGRPRAPMPDYDSLR